ncbi:MAG: hypothetical protein DME24_08330 [Verrucomicrobia bacterium]|nr:MAG: hypothetical protein DME24_08330 [Verrucomicrobiota bacterium]
MSQLAMILAAAVALLTTRVSDAGTWRNVVTNAPGSVQLMILLSDGTVMCSDGGNGAWYKLTPDSTGNYTNGSWTTLSSMNYTRRYFSSAVLRDGRVFVAGAEYGTGTTNAEIYNPLSNTWTPVPVPPGLITTNNNPVATNKFQNTAGFSDSSSIILPDGRVLIAPVNPAAGVSTVTYNPYANSWTSNTVLGNQNEATWVKLPDDSILTIDKSSTATERFIPSLNQWIPDSNTPANVYGVGAELGPALLLPNGKVFFLGGNTNTLIYTPSGTTNQGSWVAGPPIPNGQACPDAPAAMLVNGKVIFACNPLGIPGTTFPTNVSFYEYDPVANSYTRQNSPTGGLTETNIAAYQTAMLCLPDGTVLYSDETSQVYIYDPNDSPLTAGAPVINSITWDPGGSLHLTGKRLNGISQGASYGDDEQMDSNYPLVRFGDGNGGLYYGRTYNWSDTGVMTGEKVVTTEVMPPWSRLLTPGPYPFSVVVNGIASFPAALNAPTWVDYNYSGPFEFGSYVFPYNSLAEGQDDVPTGGTIAMKPGVSPEALTLTRAMTIVSVGGDVTIGR